MIERFARFVVRWPSFVLAAVLLMSAVPAYQVVNGLSLRVLLEEMLPAGRENVELFKKFGAQFGGANTTLIEIQKLDGLIYTTEFLEKYQRVSEEIYFHPDAIRHLVQSLAQRKTKAISGSGGRVKIEAIMWPDVPQTPEEMALFRRNVKAQYQGFLVSDDERSAMIIADFKDATDYGKLLTFVDGLRATEEDANTRIRVAGRPILLGTIYHALDTIYLILGASFLSVCLVLFLYFRSWIGIIVPVITASIATLWGLGVMGGIGYNLDPLLILLPAFVFAIVLSHGVQLISRVKENLEAGKSMRQAAEIGLSHLLIPSTAAIITDAAGFGVLALVAIPSIQALALICGVWLLSIGPALVFATALICLFPIPRRYRRSSSWIEKLWSALDIEHSKKAIIGTTVGLFAVGVFGSQYLTIGETKGSAILWPSSRYNLDVDTINESYSRLGTDMMQIYIEGDEDTMLNPEVYHRIEALDRYLYETVPEARPAQSLVPIIKLVNSVLYEGDPSYEIVPDTTEEVGFDIYMFRSRGEPGDFAAYTDPEWRIGNVSFFLEDHSGPTIKRSTDAVRKFFSQPQNGQKGFTFLFSGGAIGITEALNAEIKESNIKIMVAIAAVIAFCVMAYYRSFPAGLILIFSLATANFLTYAFMAAKGVGLNISTLPLAALGVGLGVDYGIYMLDRIREEFKKSGDAHDAVTRAFLTSGNAIFITAMTMVLPLLPWAIFSSLRFQAEMGLMLALVLFLNMLGSLLFLPAASLALRPKSLFGVGPETIDGGAIADSEGQSPLSTQSASSGQQEKTGDEKRREGVG